MMMFVFTHRSIEVILEFLIESLDWVAKVLKLRDDQVIPEDLGDEGKIGGQDILELVEVQ